MPVTGDLDLGVRLRAEAGEAVDLAGGDAGVVERGDDGLAGQAHLAPAGILGELGGTDADDGGLAAELVAPGHRAISRVVAASATVTVPVTW